MNNSFKIGICIGIGTFLFPKQCYSQNNINWKVPFVKVNHDAPNILFICTDQQSWNTIGAFGNAYVHTPNLNRLAEEGISFSKTYCQSPVSSPSRASFLTGLYPSTIGVTKNGNQEWTERFPTISKTLKDAGYECGLIGKYHLSTAQANRPEKRPVDDGYSYYQYSHSPYQGGNSNDYIRELREKGIDVLELKKKFGYVSEEYHQTKWIAEKAISFIKEKREWPWLLNINIYDPHGPFDAPPKYVSRYDTILDKLVELVDIVPTILDMVGLPQDYRLEGKSLYPIISKDSDLDIHTHKKHVRCEYFNQYEGKLAAGTMIRTQQYKLVTYHGFEKGELFDLINDPDEFNNLWDNDAYKEVRFQLTKESFDALASSVDRLHIPVARY